MSLLSIAEAQARTLALAAPLAEETVPLVVAAGRYAAADVIALRTQPAADLSAMDGYAIRFGELPGPWVMIGESAAGAGLGRAIAPGETARIFTGAPLPPGADTVLVQEDAAREGDRVRLDGEGPPRARAHVRPKGSDFTGGHTLIRDGELLTPARIALAAVGGHGVVAVRRKPRITLISTGDELVLPGEPTEGDRLPSSNAPMLTALLGALPVEVVDTGIVRDDVGAIADAFTAARGADIIVTTGGASVGDRDLVRPALERVGARLDFWKIAMKPGKPLMAGRLDDAVVVGLPGNPVSAYVTAVLFLLPLVRHLLGAGDPLPEIRPTTLLGPLPATAKRAEYPRATIGNEGVTPLAGQDSAALVALAACNGLIVRPSNAPPAEPGQVVNVLRIA